MMPIATMRAVFPAFPDVFDARFFAPEAEVRFAGLTFAEAALAGAALFAGALFAEDIF